MAILDQKEYICRTMDSRLNATLGLTWLLLVNSLNGIRGRTTEIRLFAPTSASTSRCPTPLLCLRCRLIPQSVTTDQRAQHNYCNVCSRLHRSGVDRLDD